jgi:hypothetical protein
LSFFKTPLSQRLQGSLLALASSSTVAQAFLPVLFTPENSHSQFASALSSLTVLQMGNLGPVTNNGTVANTSGILGGMIVQATNGNQFNKTALSGRSRLTFAEHREYIYCAEQ